MMDKAISEMMDILGNSEEALAEQMCKPSLDFDELCDKFITLNEQIKRLEKEFEPVKEKLKSFSNTTSEKHQLVFTDVESFRMKGFKDFQAKGYTKERIIKEGIGGFTVSKRIAVSRI